jgi:hypothetical protein
VGQQLPSLCVPTCASVLSSHADGVSRRRHCVLRPAAEAVLRYLGRSPSSRPTMSRRVGLKQRPSQQQKLLYSRDLPTLFLRLNRFVAEWPCPSQGHNLRVLTNPRSGGLSPNEEHEDSVLTSFLRHRPVPSLSRAVSTPRRGASRRPSPARQPTAEAIAIPERS